MHLHSATGATGVAAPVGQPIAPADETDDPFALLGEWFTAAEATELNDPNAMALATAGADGLPNVRMVLLKSFDAGGFVFYTNAGSQKGDELASNMQAAGVLHWKSLGRQVRFRGPVDFTSAEEADKYFLSRPRGSRISAWASRQSQPLESRQQLEQDVARETRRFAEGAVPRPPQWKGFRIQPVYLEFWTSGEFRLHDRLVYTREKPEGSWERGRLYP